MSDLRPACGVTAAHETKAMVEFLDLVYKENLNLKALYHRLNALHKKADAAGFLPDPVINSNLFIKPIETRVGAQKSNFTIVQGLPWPGKLDAKEQVLQASASELDHRIQEAKLDLRAKLYKLFYDGYFLERRLELTKAQKPLLENIAAIALAQVRVGTGRQQDAAAAALELARLDQDIREAEQDLLTLKNQINTIANRNPDESVIFPKNLAIGSLPNFDTAEMQQDIQNLLLSHPRLLKAKSEREVAEKSARLADLEGMPDLKLSLSWFVIDETSAMSPSKSNEDAWAIGAGISVPLWWQKYTKIDESAVLEVLAKRELYDHEKRSLENALRDMIGRTQTALELIELYSEKIVPQSEQIFLSNQNSYQQGAVTFDRVIQDFRGFLKSKIGLHRQIVSYHESLLTLEQLLGKSLTDLPQKQSNSKG